MNDVYDFTLWAIYLLMVAMGLFGSWRLIHSFKKNSFIFFSVATVMYLLLRTFHFDSIIYISLWHSVFEIYPYTNLYLTLGGNLLQIIETVVYAFLVPITLIGAWIRYFSLGMLGKSIGSV